MKDGCTLMCEQFGHLPCQSGPLATPPYSYAPVPSRLPTMPTFWSACHATLLVCTLLVCNCRIMPHRAPQVHEAVCALGVPCVLEHSQAGEYSIDVAIPSHKIAGGW